MPRKPLKGRRPHASGGWQTYCRINGKFHQRLWPLNADVGEMDGWAAKERALFGGKIEREPGGFAADVATYLAKPKIAAMPTCHQVTAHLALWVMALGGDRPSRTILRDDIERVIQAWLKPAGPDGPLTAPAPERARRKKATRLSGLAPGTVKKRRTSLRSFFSVMLAGRTNPVRGTTEPKGAKGRAREIDYLQIERVLAAMPTQRSVKRGAALALSLAPVRAAVLAFTGIPPGLLQKVTPQDLVLRGPKPTVLVTFRIKGSGQEARTLRLTEQGRRAFQRFHDCNAYGVAAYGKVNVAFQRAAASIGLEQKVRIYDLRHSFLSQMYRVTKDLATVARYAGHAEGSGQTVVYTQGANADVDDIAAEVWSRVTEERRRAAMTTAPGAALKAVS